MTPKKRKHMASLAARKDPTAGLSQRLSATLAGMAPRERQAVMIAAWVLGLALLWWVALGPALNTLRQAPERQATLDAQLTQMLRMAATAEQVRAQNNTPPPTRRGAQAAIESATAALGAQAQVSVQGDRAILTLRGVAPEALAKWLSQVRVNARLLPVEAQVQRQASPAGWAGQITLAGPGLGPNN
jgi:general secretion pathway protein M